MKVLLIITIAFTFAYCRQGFGPGEQEWNYADIRPGAHMFWWLYYTTNKNVDKPEDRPLLLWLQGGPGGSSTGIGNFQEIGPLDVDLKPRDFTWVNDYNVLFVDNPVGTGYSYVDYGSALVTNNKQIAKDLVELMKHFYSVLPKFKETPIYVMAQSYGGKMAVEFALEFEKSFSGKIKGVGLGDSWISPVDSVITWAPYLLNVGAIDIDGFTKIMTQANLSKAAVEMGNFAQAVDYYDAAQDEIMAGTNGIDFNNILKKTKEFKNGRVLPGLSPDFTRAALDELMNRQVKNALNIPAYVIWESVKADVFDALFSDFMRPVTHLVENLLNQTDIKVYVYSGQLDLIVDTPGTYAWVKRLKWDDRAKWQNTPRQPLISTEGYIEGYRKEYGNFAMYWINRAGHNAPADNPVAMKEILKRLTGV